MEVQQLGQNDVATLRQVNELFARNFDAREHYLGKPPRTEYLEKLLKLDHFLVLVAYSERTLAGALVAYVLPKWEQERSEIYIYDLAVEKSFRRQGVATALIEELKGIGKSIGAYVIFVQADTDEDDLPAIALYTKLGTREDVLHFDIEIDSKDVAMAKENHRNEIVDGHRCQVVAGTHRGKSGVVEESHISKTGAQTITVRQANGDRFKTLAKNVEIVP